MLFVYRGPSKQMDHFALALMSNISHSSIAS